MKIEYPNDVGLLNDVREWLVGRIKQISRKCKIRSAFKSLGKKGKDSNVYDRWFRKKQRERNRIEGSFGNGKEHLFSFRENHFSVPPMYIRYAWIWLIGSQTIVL